MGNCHSCQQDPAVIEPEAPKRRPALDRLFAEPFVWEAARLVQRDQQQPCPLIDSLPSSAVQEHVLALVMLHLVKLQSVTRSVNQFGQTLIQTDEPPAWQALAVTRCAVTCRTFRFAAYSNLIWWPLAENDFLVTQQGGASPPRSKYKAAILLQTLLLAPMQRMTQQSNQLNKLARRQITRRHIDEQSEIVGSMLTQIDALQIVIDAAISADISFSSGYGQFFSFLEETVQVYPQCSETVSARIPAENQKQSTTSSRYDGKRYDYKRYDGKHCQAQTILYNTMISCVQITYEKHDFLIQLRRTRILN